jgi:hypothetical protein
MQEDSPVQDVKEQTPEQEVKDVSVKDVPYGRFKEVIDEKNNMKAEFDALKQQVLKESEDRKLKEMERKGEYESALNMVRDDLSKKEQQYNELKSQLEVYESQEKIKRDSLLDQLSDDDKAIYGSLNNNALEAHVQRIKKQQVPTIGNAQPSETQGYTDLVDAARDFQKGKIDEGIYKRIRSAFRTNQA